MKASIFNSYIFNQGYLLVFNSNTNRFLIIKNASSDFCFDKFINDGIKDAEFTSNLVRAGFIVDEKADEFSSLLTLMKNGLRKEDEITILLFGRNMHKFLFHKNSILMSLHSFLTFSHLI